MLLNTNNSCTLLQDNDKSSEDFTLRTRDLQQQKKEEEQKNQLNVLCRLHRRNSIG